MIRYALAASWLPVAAFAAASADDVYVITANQFSQPVASVLAPVSVVTREEIERLQLKTVTEVLRTLPGVEISSTGGRGQTATALVRGATASQTLILIDGVRLGSSARGSVNLSLLPLNQVERIEYIRGARASIYGSDAIGGVVNLITRPDMGQDQTQLHAGIGSHGSQALDGSSSLSLGSHQLKVAAGYEDQDGYNVHPIPGLNDGDEHGFTGKNGMVDYQWQADDAWLLGAAARIYQSTSQYDGSYASYSYHERDESWNQDNSFRLSAAYQGAALQSQWLANYARTRSYDYADTQNRDQASSHSVIEESQLSWLNQLDLGQGWGLGAGVEWRKEVLLGESAAYGSAYATGDIDRENTGAYLLGQYTGEQLSAELSGRSDDNQQYGRHNTWQAGAGWTLIPGYRISALHGTAFHAPTFIDLYYPGSANPDLTPETSRNSELGLEGLTGAVLWRVTGYRNKIDQLIQWAPTDGGNWVPSNVGRARIQGVELEAEFDTGFVSHRLSADFKDPKDLDSGTQLIRRAKRNYKWVAQGQWQQLDGGLSWLYQGPRPDSDGSTLGGYSLWDLTMGYQLTSALKVQGRVENLLDKDYVIASGYVTPGRGYYLDLTYKM
ncbi:TonB-dependent receptor domain-containing protein [Pseudaeromonas paramecii]|uniref:Vitamin B12 transporter BtuB n=1 Tax=Pseudaeromonas paramecii TaxID=2138166 RepID=A0ABP8QKK6_9GAMM